MAISEQSRIITNPETLYFQSSLNHQNTKWNIYLAPKFSTSQRQSSDIDMYYSSVGHIEQNTRGRDINMGTCIEHQEALGFICDRWSEVLDIINPSRTRIATPRFDPLAYPEVKLTYPFYNDLASHSLDFVGFDELGNMYVIEVGSGHKSAQLEKQLFLARTLFPDHAVHGLIAKYTKQQDNAYRLYFRYH
jgi:hypothetical protein